jgi:cell division initiation protein
MTPNEILNKQFGKVMSGYRMEEVNAFLAEVAGYVEDLIDEKDVTEQKMLVLADKLEEYREDEDSLRAALIGAQKLGDSVVRESRKKAEQTLGDAQDEASRILRDAKEKADVIIADASEKADTISADAKKSIEVENEALNKLKAEVARFKGQIKEMLYKHMEILNSIELDEKATKPERQRPERPEKPEKPAPQEKAEEPVKQPAAEAEPESLPEAHDKNITLTFVEEQDSAPLTEDNKKETRHGELKFGDNYAIQRKE